MMQTVYAAAYGQFRHPSLHGLWHGWRNLRQVRQACNLVPAILTTIPPDGNVSPSTWRIHRAEKTFMGTVTITVGPAGQPAMAVLKLPQTAYGRAGLQEQQAVLAQLRNHPRLSEWSALLPKLQAQGEIVGQAYVVEQALPGSHACHLLADPSTQMGMQAAAAVAIEQLHQLTADSVVVDGPMLEQWIDWPLLLIQRLLTKQSKSNRYDAAIERLAAELHGALAGRTLDVSWVHGDFWAGNILMTPDGATVTGIIDWDWAAPNQLPLLDLLNLLLTTRRLVHGCQLGESVQALLQGEGWTRHERGLLDTAGVGLPDRLLDDRAMVLMCWLRHIGGHLTKSTGQADERAWVAKNITNVLESL